jgi:predicted permease
MNEIILVIIKTLPIILTLLLGVWIKKANFPSIETIRGITKFVLNISLPCLLFSSLFQAKIEPMLLILSAMVFAVCLLTFLLGFLIKKLQKSPNQFYPSIFTTFLTGPLGFPLFIAYFGAENLYKLAILDVGNTVFHFYCAFCLFRNSQLQHWSLEQKGHPNSSEKSDQIAPDDQCIPWHNIFSDRIKPLDCEAACSRLLAGCGFACIERSTSFDSDNRWF